MKILVTGGAGAVGTNLVERLVREGNEVFSWDNYSAGREENHVEGCTYHNRDTRHSHYAFDKETDLVFHLGEYSKVTPSFDEIDKVFEYNLEGSFALLESCRQHKVPLVYAASSTRLSEPGDLGSPYAFCKSTIAKLVQGYGLWYGLQYNICYFFNVFGPRTDTWENEWQTVINVFTRQKREGVPITIAGDGKQLRDFTHVDDIVEGLILASKNICNDEFQLGTGTEYSILEIAQAFDHPYEFVAPRLGERPRGLADISHSREVLGYEPRYNVIDYIKGLFEEDRAYGTGG